MRQADSSASTGVDREDDEQGETFFQAPGLTLRDISSMTVPQLKDELRERGIKCGGKKGELLQRLTDAMEGRIVSRGQ